MSSNYRTESIYRLFPAEMQFAGPVINCQNRQGWNGDEIVESNTAVVDQLEINFIFCAIVLSPQPLFNGHPDGPEISSMAVDNQPLRSHKQSIIVFFLFGLRAVRYRLPLQL